MGPMDQMLTTGSDIDKIEPCGMHHHWLQRVDGSVSPGAKCRCGAHQWPSVGSPDVPYAVCGYVDSVPVVWDLLDPQTP